MSRFLRSRLPLVAVLAALGAFLAYAVNAGALAGKNTVFADDLAANSVRSSDIKNGNVRSGDLGTGAVGSRAIADGSIRLSDLSSAAIAALSTGTQGPQGPPGPAGAAGAAGATGATGPSSVVRTGLLKVGVGGAVTLLKAGPFDIQGNCIDAGSGEVRASIGVLTVMDESVFSGNDYENADFTASANRHEFLFADAAAGSTDASPGYHGSFFASAPDGTVINGIAGAGARGNGGTGNDNADCTFQLSATT